MSDARGRLYGDCTPPGLGFQIGFSGRSAGWPFGPRRLRVYENGLMLKVLDREAWIPRSEIRWFRRGVNSLRIKWGPGRNLAAITLGFHPRQVRDLLVEARYIE